MDQVVQPFAPLSAPIPAPAWTRISFQSNRRQFRRLVMRGALLELVTIGFYRFWLATDIRRHLWRSTSVDGDALEYTGRGKELLIGALLAFAIFAPIYLGYFLIGLEAERLQAFASIPFGLFFYLFAQFAIYRARRYRLTRTVWRGVRFWMTGSGWKYAWRAGAWLLLVIITFGLVLPWREAALERYKMRHSYYGDLQGRFEGTGWQFFKRGGWLWFLILLVFALPLVEVTVRGSSGAATVTVYPLMAMIGAPFGYASFKAIQWRWWISGIRFGDVSFQSDLSRTALFGVYWKVIGWSLLLLIILAAWVAAVAVVAVQLDPAAMQAWRAMLRAPQAQQEQVQQIILTLQQVPVLIAFAVGYVLVALTFGATLRIYLLHDVTAWLADSTAVHNIAAAENVSARGMPASALGEGFADSLDIFGF